MARERTLLERYDGMRTGLMRAAALNEFCESLCQRTQNEEPLQFADFIFALHGIRPELQERHPRLEYTPYRNLQTDFRGLTPIVMGGYNSWNRARPVLGLYLRLDSQNADEGLRLSMRRLPDGLRYEGTVALPLGRPVADEPESLGVTYFPILKVERSGCHGQGRITGTAGFVVGEAAIAKHLEVASAADQVRYLQELETLQHLLQRVINPQG